MVVGQTSLTNERTSPGEVFSFPCPSLRRSPSQNPSLRRSQLRVACRVVQIASGAGIALACDDAAAIRPQFESWLARAADETDGPEAPAPLSTWGAEADSASDAASAGGSEAESGLLHDRIRRMGTSEKRRLALHGDRTARTLLLKDPNKTIHLFVIQNKGITLDEVRYIASNRQINPEVLKRIAGNREWLQNPRILVALVSNPKTPPSTAKALLPRLPPGEIRRIAKSQSAPSAVVAAARKLVVGP